jgi:hypothetical protein
MRLPFTDGWNSFWHFFFGTWSTATPVVFFIFLVYQLRQPNEKNILIDLIEFIIGYYLAWYTLLKYKE